MIKESEMINIKNEKYLGSNAKNGLYDLEIPEHFNSKIIIFIHGYMGFKDWGAWSIMQKYFVNLGYGFCKFNLTHNGIGTEKILDFTELDLFSENTYSKEIFDTDSIIDLIISKFPNSELILIGHSRGGGIALLKSNDKRISKTVTLAAISSIQKRYSDEQMLNNWKKKGIRLVINQRTKQEMPHSYLQVEDYFRNENVLSIQKACEKLSKPLLIIHGDKDTSVSIEEGQEIALWTKNELKVIQNTDHVFGASQPWSSKEMPEKLQEVCVLIEKFLS